MNTREWKNPSVIKLIETSKNPDPIDEIIKRARGLISDALQKGWSGPPFNPVELAEVLKINVVPNDTIIEARIIPLKDRKYQIEFNPYQRQQRINFSVSHELTHTLFPDCSDRIRNREEKQQDTWELEMLCNIGASEILLPQSVFAEEANAVELNIDSLIKLANKYGASLEAVLLRFTEVLEKSCSMCIAFFDSKTKDKLVVGYSKLSKSFNIPIPKQYVIPTFSKAYECANPGWTSKGRENWDLFKGNEYNLFSIGLGSLKKQKAQRVGILIAPVGQENFQPIVINDVLGDATQPRGSGIKIIGQIVNTSLGLGFGFGRSMKSRYPEIVKELKNWQQDRKNFILGKTHLFQLSDDTYVCFMLAQDGIRPKGGRIPLRYESLRSCFGKLAEEAKTLKGSVHIPPIGSGQAGGEWGIIEGMIFEELILKDISVTVYKLPGTEIKTKQKNSLTLFDEE